MNGSSHPNHENAHSKSPYYKVIFTIFLPNPMIGIAPDEDFLYRGNKIENEVNLNRTVKKEIFFKPFQA